MGKEVEVVDDALTPTLQACVDALIASGRYRDPDDVMRAAIRQMAERDELYQVKLERLRQAVAEGERSGISEGYSIEAVLRRLDGRSDAGIAET